MRRRFTSPKKTGLAEEPVNGADERRTLLRPITELFVPVFDDADGLRRLSVRRLDAPRRDESLAVGENIVVSTDRAALQIGRLEKSCGLL